jgi:Helix-loop-helix DNA-binding domain
MDVKRMDIKNLMYLLLPLIDTLSSSLPANLVSRNDPDSNAPYKHSLNDFTQHPHCYAQPPPGPILSSRRSSTASEFSVSSSAAEYQTAMTTPTTSQDKFYSPEHRPYGPMTDLAYAASVVSQGETSPHYHSRTEHSPEHYNTRRPQSYDGRTEHENAYAISPQTYSHNDYYDPHPYPRQRAASSPMTYPANYYYTTPPHPSTPPRPTTNIPSRSPPVTFDRQRAHILSEQKRRESINRGFIDLKQKLTAEHICRAIAYSLKGFETDPNTVYDLQMIFGPSSRDSKALNLKRAVIALQALGEKVLELKSENENLRSQMAGDERQRTRMVKYDDQGKEFMFEEKYGS